MHVVVDDGQCEHEVELVVNHPDAAVADLADALGSSGASITVDGRAVDALAGLAEAGVARGSVIGVGRPPNRSTAGAPTRLHGDAAVQLAVIGGLDAGGTVGLVAGAYVAGRGRVQVRLDSRTVSATHARFHVSATGEVAVADLGSTNGTWVNGKAVGTDDVDVGAAVVRLGAVEVQVEAVPAADRPAGLGRGVAFNRPPRPAGAPADERLRAPSAPSRGSHKPPFNVVMVLTPALGAVAAALASPGHRSFLVVALASPLMAGLNQVAQRRGHARSNRRAESHYRDELVQFDARLAALSARHRARLLDDHPHAAEVGRRAATPSRRLWERRPGHHDFLAVRLGQGRVPWQPPVDGLDADTAARPADAAPPAARAADIVERHSWIDAAPVAVSLAGGGVLGIAGDRDAALALARSLVVQVATHHGPADVPLTVLASAEHGPSWSWCRWLPHAQAIDGAAARLAVGPEACAAAASSALAGHRSRARDAGSRDGLPASAAAVIVVDDESLFAARQSPVRALLRGDGGAVAGIVIATSRDRLPAVCTCVVQLDGPDGTATFDPLRGGVAPRPDAGGHTCAAVPVGPFLVAGLSLATAERTARALARFDDPELQLPGAALPDRARLAPLLGLADLDAASVAERWAAAGPDPSPQGPIGVCELGVFTIDLVRDGPHGLVAGTTGAGKSELLRTIVASLAVGAAPRDLTFLLVDYKGGSAFLDCARLPHTVGLVTDLDANLGARVLRSLDAELRHRERRLRDAGVSDLASYRQAHPDGEPMPRLVVVIDEFATLKTELPEFIDALVGVAQRGRSLGVHLVLATQRPAGAISDNIRANTNLRIALRVQDAADSSDVIGCPDAAGISRAHAGRAFVRLGPGEIVAIQTALATAGAERRTVAPVDIVPHSAGSGPAESALAALARGGSAPPPAIPQAPADGEQATDLARLVGAARAAFAAAGGLAPRRPWLEPLPSRLPLSAVWNDRADDDTWVPIALADDPDRQAQYPFGWRLTEGNLLLAGLVGSGTSTALAALGLTAAHRASPTALHLYALDFGAGDLGCLEPLPHTGAVIGAGERERQGRLLRTLGDELDRRRTLAPDERGRAPRIVLLVDGFATFRSTYDDANGVALLERFGQVFADGPAVGIHTAVTVDRAGLAAGPIGAACRQKWAFRLADRSDYGTVGVRLAAMPDFGAGGAVTGEHGLVVQVGLPDPHDAGEVASRWVPLPALGLAAPIGTLARDISIATLPAAAVVGRPWRVPVGIGEATLAPVSLQVFEGEHVLVAGPARSGKSTVLAAIGAALAGGGARLVVVAGVRSPLATLLDAAGVTYRQVAVDDLASLAAHVAACGRDGAQEVAPVAVLVDDADGIDDAAGTMEALVTDASPVSSPVVVVAAARVDALRGGYGHWTRAVRRGRLGVLLHPGDLDGELLGTAVPRRPGGSVPIAGRGVVVVAGIATPAQLAR